VEAVIAGMGMSQIPTGAPKRRGRPPKQTAASVIGQAIDNATPPPKKRTMSAEGRARIAAAQRARWAKIKRGK
jgi:hypothetical protein